MCLYEYMYYMNCKVYVVLYYIICYIDAEGFLNITGSHVCCKSGSNLEMVQDTDHVTGYH